MGHDTEQPQQKNAQNLHIFQLKKPKQTTTTQTVFTFLRAENSNFYKCKTTAPQESFEVLVSRLAVKTNELQERAILDWSLRLLGTEVQ